MKQPLLGVVLLFLSGIVAGDRLQLPLAALFALCCAFILISVKFERARVWALAALLFFAGWTNYAVHTGIVSPVDLRVLIEDRSEYVTVRGSLAETPREKITEKHDLKTPRTLAVLEVNALRRAKEWEPAHGKILVTTPGVLDEEYYSRQTVEVTGVIARPPTPLAPGLMDYRQYLRRQGIYYELQSESPNDWAVIANAQSPNGPSWASRFGVWARATLAKGLPEEDEAVDLQRAMALGWRTGLTEEVAQPFMRAGTMYLFAISGLHIAIVGALLIAILRTLLVPRAYCGLVIIPLLWFYTAATGWPASAIRATTMTTIIIAGWSLGRPANLLNSLFAAAVLLLAWDPQQLFQTSFQLSFLVVLIMGLLLPHLDSRVQRWLAPDPLLPEELVPVHRRWFNYAARAFAGYLAVSLSCWLGSLPLTAYYFHLFTPMSLLTSLAIVPLAMVSLMSSLGSFVCGDLFPATTELFNYSGWFSMWLMTKICVWVSTVPGSWRSVAAPHALQIVFYYALIVAVFSGWIFSLSWRKWIAVTGSSLMVFGFTHTNQPATTGSLTVLQVNGGDAIFYESPESSERLLIDCGNENAAAHVVTPFLHSRGLDHLPQLLLTHGDIRHVGGTETVRQEFGVEHVLTSSVKSRSAPYRRIIADLEKSPANWRKVHRGDTIGPWHVLHPLPSDHFAAGDDNAIVLRGDFAGARILLVSDLGQLGQQTLLEREKDLRADIVVAGLPTKGEPLSDEFLDAVQPRAIIISCAYVPVQESAKKDLRQRLAKRNVPVYYTSDVNSVTVELEPKTWRVLTMGEQGDR